MVRQRVLGCAALALLGLLAGGLGGCWNPFAPPPGDPPVDPPDWELRDSPQHVLDNLITAYQHKDAEHYLDCLAEDFYFFLNPDDVAEDPELPPCGYWGKAEERVIHEEMLGADGAESITLTLTQDGDPIEVPQPNPDDPPHWQYKESVDLRVYVILEGIPTTLWATAPSLYEFRIDVDQEGPNGETLWEICAWHDQEAPTRNPIATDEGTEIISLGRAKAMYLP